MQCLRTLLVGGRGGFMKSVAMLKDVPAGHDYIDPAAWERVKRSTMEIAAWDGITGTPMEQMDVPRVMAHKHLMTWLNELPAQALEEMCLRLGFIFYMDKKGEA